MTNPLDGLIRLEIEERLSDLEISQQKPPKPKSKQKEKKKAKNIQDGWDSYERCNKCVTGTPQGEERERNRRSVSNSHD